MNVFLKLLCVISPTHRQTDRKIKRLMLLFCPLCGGLLIINNENDSSAFTCKSCVYTFPIKDKSYSARVELTRKKVDDVLGGEDAWKNVDSTEGKTLLFQTIFFIFPFIFGLVPFIKFYHAHPLLLFTSPSILQSLAQNAKILALTLCKFKSDQQTNLPPFSTNVAIILVGTNGVRASLLY